MKDLSVLQEYLLCALNEKGKFPILGNARSTCFVAGAIFELLNHEFVKIDDNKLVINRELDNQFSYLSPIYNFIKNSKPKTIKSLASNYIISFKSKKLNELIHSVGQSLVMEDCANEKNKQGIIRKNKVYFIPKAEKIDHVVQKIRAELLENGKISDETVCLVSLLNKGGILKKYFSKYESLQLKNRLKEIKNSAPNKMIKEMLDYIDSIMVAIIVATSSSR